MVPAFQRGNPLTTRHQKLIHPLTHRIPNHALLHIQHRNPTPQRPLPLKINNPNRMPIMNESHTSPQRNRHHTRVLQPTLHKPKNRSIIKKTLLLHNIITRHHPQRLPHLGNVNNHPTVNAAHKSHSQSRHLPSNLDHQIEITNQFNQLREEAPATARFPSRKPDMLPEGSPLLENKGIRGIPSCHLVRTSPETTPGRAISYAENRDPK